MYQKYQEQAGKAPGLAKAAGKEYINTRNTFEQQVAFLKVKARLEQEAFQAAQQQQKVLIGSDRLWTSMAKSTKSVAGSIVDATRSLLSWSTIITGVTGLLGAGGLFGLDKMAHGVAGERQTAMGLGMSIGQMKAFGTNFSRAVNPDAFLNWISQMESDPSKRATANALGFNISGDAETDALAALKALRSKSKQWNPALYGTMLNAFGVGGIDVQGMRRLNKFGGDEWAQMFAGNQRDIGKFNIEDDTAKKWQDFSTKLEEAGHSIWKIFVNGLEPLTGPLSHLSDAFVGFTEKIMRKDVLVEEGINTLAGWIESFSGKIGKPEFLKLVENFTSDIGVLAKVMHDITVPFRTAATTPAAMSDMAGGVGNFLTDVSARSSFLSDPKQKAYLARLGLLEKTYKLPPGLLAYEWQRESGSDLSGKFNTPNAKGAVGNFQLTPIALKEIYDKANLRIDPTDPLQSALGAAVLNNIHNQSRKGNVSNLLGDWNWGSGNMDSYLSTGHGAKGQSMPAETRNYISGGTRIEINNNTGGNAVVSAAPLAH